MKRTGAQIVWETLEKEGVDTIFGFPGGTVLPLYDAMLQYPIHHVLVRHEQGAAHMADGYARASGRVGVALATSGPGAANMVSGIATAMMDSSPVVFLTGQVPSNLIGYDAFQEADMTGVTLPITKHNYLVTDVKDLGYTLREAFYIARSGRPGPVLVDIPKDVQTASTDWCYETTPIELPGYRPRPTSTSRDIERALDLIRHARRPLILAGRGVHLSDGARPLRRFAETLRTPVAFTLLGLGGLPADHPLNLGMMGMHGDAWVNLAIQQADLLIAIGMRFDDRATGSLDSFAPHARKIHFEIDPAEINKNVRVDAALVGDLRENLNHIMPFLEAESGCTTGREEWLAAVCAARRECERIDIQNFPEDGNLYAAHIIRDLWEITRGEALIVTDVGQHQMWAAQYYRTQKPRSFITSGGLGTMGFGLPAAIGASFTRPQQEIWLVVGDGGFQMTQAELSTAAQEGVKVNIALINNGYLGMVRQWQELFYERRYAATPLRSPDFVKIAEAHGLTGIRVEERSAVRAALQKAQRTPGTVLIDFRVFPEDAVYPMVAAGKSLSEMIRRPQWSEAVAAVTPG